MRFLNSWFEQTFGHANSLRHQGNPARGLFVLGTDTDVGKTYVSCLLVRYLREQLLAERGPELGLTRGVGVYKPVASGWTPGEPGDPEHLLAAAGEAWPLERVCPQRFLAPLAPPLAAQREGRQVDPQLLLSGAQWWTERCDILLVEGAGGALSPLSTYTTVLDLAAELKYPVILIAEHRLGMMNHILLTLEAIERRKLECLALIINEVRAPNDRHAQWPQLNESLLGLAPFCPNLPCWISPYAGSTLSPAATYDTMNRWKS